MKGEYIDITCKQAKQARKLGINIKYVSNGNEPFILVSKSDYKKLKV